VGGSVVTWHSITFPAVVIDGSMVDMTDKKIWFITGAARGMGVDIAKAALAAGHAVVATARRVDAITKALGEHDDMLAVALDITDPDSAADAVSAAVARFGRIDVLVNNAGNFYAGYFENISPEQFRAQMETNFFGPLNVTRAVLPAMREQRSGQVITVTSAAGLMGQEFCSAYAASKFALEGWMESLRYEVEPFGVATMVVEPGFFRTELLEEGSSTIWPELDVEDYAARTAQTIEAWKQMNGQQGGDPSKLADALVTLSDGSELPLRFVAGADVFPWAFAIAQRLFIDGIRRGKHEVVADTGGGDPVYETTSRAPSPDDLLHSKRVAQALARELAKIPETHRVAFELIKTEGLSMREAAAVLGTTVTAVKLRCHRAYVALRAVLTEAN